jgi:hypothetical protein
MENEPCFLKFWVHLLKRIKGKMEFLYPTIMSWRHVYFSYRQSHVWSPSRRSPLVLVVPSQFHDALWLEYKTWSDMYECNVQPVGLLSDVTSRGDYQIRSVFWLGNLKKIDSLQEGGVEWRLLLKKILKKQSRRSRKNLSGSGQGIVKSCSVLLYHTNATMRHVQKCAGRDIV